MSANKLDFSMDVVNVVRELCKTAFNLQSDEERARMFGLEDRQMEEAVYSIVNALPDSVFEKLNANLLEEIKYICAREYIFFQVQESSHDPHYREDLQKFIRVFSRDVQHRMKLQEPFKSTMREGK